MRDSHTVLPVSVHMNGEYGIAGMCLSIPTVVGRGGAEQVLEIELSQDELRKLRESSQELRQILDEIQ